MNTIQIQVVGECEPRTIEISEKLIRLVRERRYYHEEIDYESKDYDHFYDLNDYIRIEVASLAGIDPELEWEDDFQDLCWAIEDIIDSQRLKEAAE